MANAGFAQPPANREVAEQERQKQNRFRGRAHTTVSQQPGYLGD